MWFRTRRFAHPLSASLSASPRSRRLRQGRGSLGGRLPSFDGAELAGTRRVTHVRARSVVTSSRLMNGHVMGHEGGHGSTRSRGCGETVVDSQWAEMRGGRAERQCGTGVGGGSDAAGARRLQRRCVADSVSLANPWHAAMDRAGRTASSVDASASGGIQREIRPTTSLDRNDVFAGVRRVTQGNNWFRQHMGNSPGTG